MTVQGHADSAEYGRDLVCAAVSALAYTIAANAAILRDNKTARSATIILDPGDVDVRVNPRALYRGRVRRIFSAVCNGFQLLANQYPQNVSYEERL